MQSWDSDEAIALGAKGANVTKHCPDEGLKRRRRIRAARNHNSDKQADQNTLWASPDDASSAFADLGSSIRARFAPLGGVELELPPRDPIRSPPHFD